MLCSEVRGQDMARGYFRGAIRGGRLSHAYLLAGPEGVGKRRFADGLTAALLCRGRSSGAIADEGPCLECRACRLLGSPNHPAVSVIEPEEGKSIEIDTIREAVASLALKGWPRRVIILDGADRLTLPAANALLKTLEEPPPGVVFLLVTSRPSHLLATIHSRCHRVPFTTLGQEDFEATLGDLGVYGSLLPNRHGAAGGAPGVALRILTGIGECGGLENFQALLDGQGIERPESLIEFVPDRGREPVRERVRRLLELLLVGTWGLRDGDPERRQILARRSVAIAELIRDLEGNQNPELILESLPAILTPSESL